MPRRVGLARRASSTGDAQFDLLAEYQAGDWRGVWTTTTVSGDAAAPPQKMRTHLELVEGGSAIHHVNTPNAGEAADYGTYRASEPLRSKQLPRAFLFGPSVLPPAAKAEPGAWATEIGLRLADARVRVVFVATAELLRFTVIREADGDANYAQDRQDLWADSAAPSAWQGSVQRFDVEDECWVAESVSGGTEEDTSWCGENRAEWSDSPLSLQARPGAAFASDDYLKYALDGPIRVAAPASWAAGDQKTLAVEWAPAGSRRCLVARVEVRMGDAGAPSLASFLVEDLDEVRSDRVASM